MTSEVTQAVTDERSPAQFFFEMGFGACYAEAIVRNGNQVPFPLSDEEMERQWAISREAYDDPAELDAMLARIESTRLTAQSGEGRSGAGEDAPEIRALKAAKQFIENGIEMGFIRMPDASTPDSAHETLPLIRAALNARQSGEGEREEFLTAYVSEDAKVIGIEHDTDADWHKVHDAHVALRDRLEERIREREKCPRKPALRATDDAGGA